MLRPESEISQTIHRLKPALPGPHLLIDLAAFIAAKAKPDRVVALEEFDVMTAALIREHLCLPGMNSSMAKTFRDKLAMAVRAKAVGLDVPELK